MPHELHASAKISKKNKFFRLHNSKLIFEIAKLFPLARKTKKSMKTKKKRFQKFKRRNKNRLGIKKLALCKTF